MVEQSKMVHANNDPRISVILPVYNTKDYLAKCLDSILGQTYTNLEIICIDDGSTDGSGRILDEYAERDGRIKAVHQKNGGESNARNRGLQMMTGRYVGFMDCDDWIEPAMYEELVSAALVTGADLIASTWYYDTEKESIKTINQRPVSQEVFGREELLNYLYKRDYYRGFAYMWNKLYRRELFYDPNKELMLFDEDLVLGGDVLYLAKLALRTRSAFYIDKAFYHYIQRDASGCHTQDLKRREDWLLAYKRMITYMNMEGGCRNILPWIKRFLAYHSSNLAEMAYGQNNVEVLERCQRLMRQYEKEYCSTNREYPDRLERYDRILKYGLEDSV